MIGYGEIVKWAVDKIKNVRYNVHIGDDFMTTMSAVALRKNLFGMLGNAIKYNEAINVSTRSGNVVILSEEEYNGLIATLELSSNHALRDKILAGKNEPIDECLNIDEVCW